MSSEGEGKRRWNPTVEQVRILERVYKAGNHRPSTVEIHHITHLLSRYGCVQGINVFYWFKNRKARDKRNMHASALRVKWGGLKSNTGGSGCDQRHLICANEQEVAVSMKAVCDSSKLCVEVNKRTEEKPLQTLQLFPPCEK